MSKIKTISIAILLMLAGIIIHVLNQNNTTQMDNEIVGFFSGILFGVGIATLVQALIRKKK